MPQFRIFVCRQRPIFVLVGEDPGSKLEKARELGIKLLQEPQLLVKSSAKPTAKEGQLSLW